VDAFAALVMIGALLALIAMGMPIGFALFTVGLSGLVAQKGWNATQFIAGNFPFTATAQLALIVLPLFLFMGHMAFASGVSARAFEAARTLVGHLAGGLAIASVFACAAFATVCGSSVATASTMARVAIPEMVKGGYPHRFAAGTVAAAGTLGVLIPPSGVLVVYAIATDVSLPALLVAALVPGLLTAVAYAVAIHLWVRFDPRLRAETLVERRATARARWQALGANWETLVLFLVAMPV
jgi:tripartite ATP-independent transporter DctM subunit